MERIGTWANDVDLSISPSKSQATLFTSNTHQAKYELNIHLGQARIPTDRFPKILGVTFNNLFSFTNHIDAVAAKARKRLHILKALSGTDWGHSKETMLATFKALIRPLFTYAAPIWYPNSSPTSISKLQRIQNAAIRVIIGCHRLTAIAC